MKNFILRVAGAVRRDGPKTDLVLSLSGIAALNDGRIVWYWSQYPGYRRPPPSMIQIAQDLPGPGLWKVEWLGTYYAAVYDEARTADRR